MAAVQTSPRPGQKEANLARIFSLLDNLSGTGIDLFLLPEMCVGGYILPDREAYEKVSESCTGETFHLFSNWCNQNNSAIVYGFSEKQDGVLFNSQNYISRNGSLLTTYRKASLYNIEQNYFEPGEDYPGIVFDMGHKFALGICNDVNNNEFIRRVHLAGADFVLISSSWLLEGQDVVPYWLDRFKGLDAKTLIANAWRHQNGIAFAGRSCALLPSKQNMAVVAKSYGDAVVIAFG